MGGGQGGTNVSGVEEKLCSRLWQSSDSLHLIH